MMNFYEFYNKTGLDKEHYGVLIEKLKSHDYQDDYTDILHIIMKAPYYAYYYAQYVIGGRWEAAESHIKKSSTYSYYYAINIMKERWLEAEPMITVEFWWDLYCEKFGIE
jgi:hypothetical protein